MPNCRACQQAVGGPASEDLNGRLLGTPPMGLAPRAPPSSILSTIPLAPPSSAPGCPLVRTTLLVLVSPRPVSSLISPTAWRPPGVSFRCCSGEHSLRITAPAPAALAEGLLMRFAHALAAGLNPCRLSFLYRHPPPRDYCAPN